MLTKGQESTIRRHYNRYKNNYINFQKEILNFIKDTLEPQSRKKKIDIVDIKSRNNINQSNKIKSIKSIIDNLKKGKYEKKEYNKLTDIKDIAGIRITCHCKDDSDRISSLLKTRLKDKYDAKEDPKDRGSYRGVHLIVSKSVKKEKIYCEIQLRTVLENAWAVQDHRYFYKYKKHFSEGDRTDMKTITDSLSGILSACEDLWELVKIKSKK